MSPALVKNRVFGAKRKQNGAVIISMLLAS